jgi:MFS family permease
MLMMTCASLACSFAFGWMMALPLWLLTAIALFYNLAAIADSSVYSTALAEVVPPQRLGAAYSVRSVLGFGAGAVSPFVFGAILDLGRSAYGEASVLPWGLAWASLGFGALLGPWMILRLQRASPVAGARGG